MLHLGDVAMGLSNCSRFAGQLPNFYSVAQHVTLVSTLVDPSNPRLQLYALHHDDSEAFLGDVSRNLKHSPFMFGYRVLEKRMETALEIGMGLPRITPREAEELKEADNLATLFEHVVMRTGRDWTPEEIIWGVRNDLLPGPVERYSKAASYLGTTIRCWSPEESRREFILLDAYYRERVWGICR